MSDHPFFQSIYKRAEGDGTNVPWADLAPKSQFVDWLHDNPGNGGTAVDVACGLGDNAEAAAAAGWKTDAFDFSSTAIDWAKSRFPNTEVAYCKADLFNLPNEWHNKFDLVWECFTIQSFEPADHFLVGKKVASLVADGGTLIVYAMTRTVGSPTNGPPFPLTPIEEDMFADIGLSLLSRDRFELDRRGSQVPHSISIWSKNLP